MLFCTQEFLLFFVVVLAAYWALPWPRARTWLLLGASLYFYASWNVWLAGIIVASTTADYLIARGLDASSSAKHRRWLLAGSLSMNLGLLFYFKYANFFLQSLEAVLKATGHAAYLPVLSVILPIGISFYTFEAISYTVDVYRRRLRAERSLIHFMLFITFFPHLVAGPIVRARDFLPQIGRRKRGSWARVHLGCRYILIGMFKKLVIADHMSVFADPVFAAPQYYCSSTLWIASFAYALQIYCDFSGYSDLALGTARLLGFRLAENFNMPYFATNIGDFWRRWHISLSTWLRDYLYIPLGGSREGRWRTYLNLLIVMLLAGLWHGASWTFIAWGLCHALLQIGHRLFRDFAAKRSLLQRTLQSLPGTVLRIAITFTVCCLAWVIFRSATLPAAAHMLSRMLWPTPGLAYALPIRRIAWAAMVLLVAHLLALDDSWKKVLDRLPAPVRGLSYAAALLAAVVLTPATTQTFIYFQF